MLYIIINLVAPPLAMLLYLGKNMFTYFSLALWCIALYLFLAHSVLQGIVLYCALTILTLILTWKPDKKPLQFDTLGIGFLSIFILSSFLFTNSIYGLHSEFNRNSAELAAKNYNKGNLLYAEKCGVCHQLNDSNYVGPSLGNIILREAGSYPDYNYSENLRKAKFLWTKEKLKLYLQNQNDLVPGTRMIISPMTEEDIDTIIAFLDSKS
jgi:cytochrome c